MNRIDEGAWVHLDFHGPHYAVVLHNLGDHCVIIAATSTRHTHLLDTCEEVWPDTAEGRILGLTAATYFYPNNCTAVRKTKLTVVRSRCPPRLSIALRALCEPQLAGLQHLHAAELDALIIGVTSGVKGRR